MDEQAYRQAEGRFWDACGARPSERFLRLPRLGVRVRVQEVGDGPPVLYLHGGPNAGATWAPLAARLPGVRSLLLDRPGTGLSDPLPIRPGNLHDIAGAFVADALDALELPRAHVVASSFGGMLALRSAAATPARIDRMVQMGCPAGAPGWRMPAFMRLLALPGMARLSAAMPPGRRAARAMLRQVGHGHAIDHDRLPAGFIDWYLAMQRHTDTMRHEGAMVAAFASPRGRWHPAIALGDALLAAVEAPTLLLWGADDAFGGEDVARRTASAMLRAEVDIAPHAGHLPWIDDPARAAAAVAGFLAGARDAAREAA